MWLTNSPQIGRSVWDRNLGHPNINRYWTPSPLTSEIRMRQATPWTTPELVTSKNIDSVMEKSRFVDPNNTKTMMLSTRESQSPKHGLDAPVIAPPEFTKGPSKVPVQFTSSLFKPSADCARYTAYLGRHDRHDGHPTEPEGSELEMVLEMSKMLSVSIVVILLLSSTYTSYL